MASEWDGVHPLIDPFSGSGTIPIEAALLARKIPPGLNRQFGFQHWRGYEQAKWEVLVESARRGILAEAPGAILGSDRDSGAVTAAKVECRARRGDAGSDTGESERVNAQIAWSGGLDGHQPTLRHAGRGAPTTAGSVRQPWQHPQEDFPGWHLTMLVAAGGLERQTGIALRTVLETNNGGIVCEPCPHEVYAIRVDFARTYR
jgi:putative N6-adenine-specific DNA methylase